MVMISPEKTIGKIIIRPEKIIGTIIIDPIIIMNIIITTGPLSPILMTTIMFTTGSIPIVRQILLLSVTRYSLSPDISFIIFMINIDSVQSQGIDL